MNYFLIIKESWIENLRLLKPENLSKLLLVSLKAIIENIKFLSLYFLGFLLLKIFFPVFVEKYFMILFGGLCFNIVLSIRSSVKLKYLKYYLECQKYLIPVFILILGFYLINNYFDIKLFVLPVLWVLFITDSKLNVYNFFASGYRAFLMLILNLPIFIIIRFLLFGLVYLLKFSKFFINYYFAKYRLLNLSFFSVFYIIMFLVLLYFIALLCKIYAKRVHEQFNLYF